MKVAEAWKPGHAGKDDGVVLALFLADRKLRIEVGYGLEDKVPDAIASRIISEQIAPELREGRLYDGLLRGVEAIAAAATGQPLPPPARVPKPSSAPFGLAFLLLFVLVPVVINGLARMGRARHFASRRPFNPLPWWMGMMIGHSMGSSRRGGRGFGSSSGFGGGPSGGGFGGGSFGGGGASGGW
jgi:uncharacterized protein